MAAFRIERRLGIPAPIEVVWEVLSDLKTWSAWNPIYPEVKGVLRIAERLQVTEALPDLEPVAITPTVVDWVPDAQILWRLSEGRGFVKRLRYMELEKLSDHGCIFSNGEDWSGGLTRWVGADRRRASRQGFAAMGQALSDQAVALWRERGGAPTSAT